MSFSKAKNSLSFVARNPTPNVDSLITARWERYTIANQEFMDIGETLTPNRRVFGGRLDAWHDFQNRFNPWYP
jgi:hypothetical protein